VMNPYKPSKRSKRFFEFARKMAMMSDYGKFRHGAVLVKHGAVMSAGLNKDKPCSFGERFRSRGLGEATIHAELCVILNVPRKQTENADVYVVRVGANNDVRNSRPCPMCQEALRFVGVKRVYFSGEGGQFQVMKL